MKTGELWWFLSEYQSLLNEQIFVFREITAFSLGSFPDVTSETAASNIWEELRTKKHLLLTQETCTLMHCYPDPKARKFWLQIPPLLQLRADFWHSNGMKHPFCLVSEFQKIADLKPLSYLLIVHLPTSGAPRLKLENQAVRCVTFHFA